MVCSPLGGVPAPVWDIYSLQSLQGCCQLWHGERPTALALVPFLSIYCLFSDLLPFLEHVFTEVAQTPLTGLEVSQIWFMGSACGGSVVEWLEMAVSGTGQSLITSHRGHSCTPPPYQNITIYTQNRATSHHYLKKASMLNIFFF